MFALFAWAVALLPLVQNAHAAILQYPQTSVHHLDRSEDLNQKAAALAKTLSKAAKVILPSNPEWDELQIRGSSPRVSPKYTVVVEVATESDVQLTVSLAHRYSIPFLAVSGTHGWTETLNKLPYGIQINMRHLNRTTVNSDGKTATVQGGTLQYEITRSLFAKGKYAVTGLAECVSAVGPLLGGGHSLLQNQYGYALDNLVSAKVVLANGTTAEASSTKNPHLFWALKGAGQNFAIVTSMVVKVYNVPSNWTVYSFIFTQDKLEALFALINKFEEPSTPRPTKLALTGVFARIPDLDPNSPVIAYNVVYEGTQAQAAPYAAQFQALGPAATTISTDVDYVQLYTVTGNNLGSQACVRNNNILGSGVNLPAWDLAGLRKAFTVFGNATADARFSKSITLLENYGVKGVRAVDSDTTALAKEEREYPVLASPVFWWDGDDEKAHKDAFNYAQLMREAMFSGVDKAKQKRHTYVNYAIGNEPKEQLYGYEAWRLGKLNALKKQWDPENQFGWYNPIVS